MKVDVFFFLVSVTGDVEGCSENKDLPECNLPKQSRTKLFLMLVLGQGSCLSSAPRLELNMSTLYVLFSLKLKKKKLILI